MIDLQRPDIVEASFPHLPGAQKRARLVAKGVELEQARIIKLLEDWQDSVMGVNNPFPLMTTARTVIALIKGEEQ